MRYMLLMAGDGAEEPSPAEIAAMPEMVSWQQDMQARGVAHEGVRLRPPGEAVTVRVRDGVTSVTDGPFADTEEQIAGYELIEATDLDQAIEAASGHPTSHGGSVEIRPFHIWPEG